MMRRSLSQLPRVRQPAAESSSIGIGIGIGTSRVTFMRAVHTYALAEQFHWERRGRWGHRSFHSTPAVSGFEDRTADSGDLRGKNANESERQGRVAKSELGIKGFQELQPRRDGDQPSNDRGGDRGNNKLDISHSGGESDVAANVNPESASSREGEATSSSDRNRRTVKHRSGGRRGNATSSFIPQLEVRASDRLRRARDAPSTRRGRYVPGSEGNNPSFSDIIRRSGNSQSSEFHDRKQEERERELEKKFADTGSLHDDAFGTFPDEISPTQITCLSELERQKEMDYYMSVLEQVANEHGTTFKVDPATAWETRHGLGEHRIEGDDITKSPYYHYFKDFHKMKISKDDSIIIDDDDSSDEGGKDSFDDDNRGESLQPSPANNMPEPEERSREYDNNFSDDLSSHVEAEERRREGRRGNSNDGFSKHHHGGNSQFSPSYISNLERRAREHIASFPLDESRLSLWLSTAVEIIMSMSELWGRDSYRGNQIDREQLVNAVSLSDELLAKVLLTRKQNVDRVFKGRHGNDLRDVESDVGSKVRGQSKRLDTEILCQVVTLGWSRCDPKAVTNAGRKALSILEQLEDICLKRERLSDDAMQREKSRLRIQDGSPSVLLYNNVLSCWARSLDPDAQRQGMKLFERMVKSRGTFSKPSKQSYNNMMNLHANRGAVNAAKTLLEEMEQSDDFSPDVYSYTILMNAYQKRFTSRAPDSRDMQDPERAEELLSQLVANYEESKFRDDNLRPTNVTFSTIIAMYAQADRMLKEDNVVRTRSFKERKIAIDVLNKKDLGWGAANAERVLDWMIGLSERERRSRSKEGDAPVQWGSPDNELIRPSTRHFVTVMDAWAKAGKGVEGAQRCERLLDRLISLHDELGYELRPIPLCFGPVINAWAKANKEYETAQHAESLLDRMEELFLHQKSSNPKKMLSNIAYNIVIDAWSRRSGRDAAERAEKVLRRLINNYQLTNNRFLRPDVISYTNVIKAYVNRPDGGEKALEILEEMKVQSKDGNTTAKPDWQSLSVAMDACAKSGLTSEAERILNSVEDSKKTRVMFNTVMSGYKNEGRGEEAEAVLRRMIELEKSGSKQCSPDLISYAMCIEAWGNGTSQERGTKVIDLLGESIERYIDGDSRCKPSSITFNMAAGAVSSVDDPDVDKVGQVLSMFEMMEKLDCEADLVSFNLLIKTCAYTTGSRDRKETAMEVATHTFNSLSRAEPKADSITYTSMAHAMLYLMEESPEKIQALAGLFRQCCDDGCLNQNILNTLAKETTKRDFLTITGVSSTKEAPKISSFPAEWTYRSRTLQNEKGIAS